MATWKDVETAEPEFAARVRKLFDAHKHKTIATLRADGSPRISGIEAELADGELTFGSMPHSRKGADLIRDPRFALHSPAVDPEEGNEAAWQGDAKIAGRAARTGHVSGPDSGDSFRAEIDEASLVRLDESASRLVIQVWTPAGGLRRIERA